MNRVHRHSRIFYRIEDIDKPMVLSSIILQFDPPGNLRSYAMRSIDRVLEETSKNINHHGHNSGLLSRDDLLPEVIDLARKYGYEGY